MKTYQKSYKKGDFTLLISLDHGNKYIKCGTSGKVFSSGLHESDTRPPFGEEILKYNGKYYTISDKRIPYLREKMSDDRFYILTLFAIAFEIEKLELYDHELMHVHLLVGLPPAHYGAQYERFEEYFKRGKIEEFEFKGTMFRILIKEALSFPQAFAAAMPVYKRISDNPKVIVIDLGGFTVDYLLIKNGNPDLSVCDTLEHGVIIMYNQIISRVNSSLNVLLEESDIDSILKEEYNNFDDDVKRIVYDTAHNFVSDLFGRLRERAIDLRSGKVVFVGGGSILLRKQIEELANALSPLFVKSISANAKGYELLYTASNVVE